MNLADRLAKAGEIAEMQATRQPVPTGWEPGIKYETSGQMTITVPPMQALTGEDGWKQAVEALGVQVPDGWRLRLVEARYDPAAWHRDGQGDDAVTRAIWRYRFVCEPAPRTINVEELISAIGKRRTTTVIQTDASTYVVAAGDLQIGKSDGNGTPGTVDRFIAAHEASLRRFQELRKAKRVSDVALLWVGDCIEGTETQGSRLLARLDVDITAQVRIYRRLMLRQVKDYLDLGARVRVAAVPGNHDEAKRVGNTVATRYDDSWAIEGAAAVADALDIAGYGDQAAFVFPGRDELTITLDIGGTVVGLLHGHQTKGKMQNWLANQSLGREAVGHSTDLVISGHYHHLRIHQIGPVTHVQVPAMDGGSTWWRHQHGLSAPPGMVTMLVGGGTWSGLEIV